jgi:SAM-dependent methyltransferase
MHNEQKLYCERVKRQFPEYFVAGTRVLDIGSLDINGNNRYLWYGGEIDYTGIDVGPGPNVDIVMSGHVFRSEKPFNVVISTECLEHNKTWQETIFNAHRLLHDGGLMLLTMAGYGRPEHGTFQSHPSCSPHTHEHYENITTEMLLEGLKRWFERPIEEVFSRFSIEYDSANQDLYLWGKKKPAGPISLFNQ